MSALAAAPAKSQIVILSDLHIGDDSPTVWYQSGVHNPYLQGICDWILANHASIREVVLLGDVVDFWTYPADRQPPSLARIVAKQPAIFGPAGMFGKVLDALGGAVTYMPGNHDIGVQPNEVAAIVSAGGHPMKFADGVYYPLGAGDHRIALAHGHAYTMFNAPDPLSPWAPLPVGHFVTRMISTHLARQLAPGHTVATLAGQGNPNGLDVGAIISGAVAKGSVGIVKLLLDSVAAQTGTPENQSFILPHGQTVRLDTQVRPAFDNLFTRWIESNGGGAVGALIAGKSALADALSYYMGWFAQRQAFQSGAELVVLGHTHTPISGLEGSMIHYVNSGFECASAADMPPKAINFAVIDIPSMTAQVMQSANHGAAIQRYTASTTPIVEKGFDFSCCVVIDNPHADAMTLSGAPHAGHGYWVVPPPASIPPGGRAMLWLQDFPGPVGTEGTATYHSASRGAQTFSFACPTGLSTNSCHGGARFRTRSGAPANWGQPGSIARWGHPFFVEFTA